MASEFEPLVILVAGAALGLFVGLERERTSEEDGDGEPGSSRSLGARTFALVGLLGASSGLLVPLVGAVGWASLAVALAFLLVTNLRFEANAIQNVHLTTTVAATVIFGLGALLSADGLGPLKVRLWAAITGALLTVVLLSAKAPIHRFARGMTTADLIATLKFGVLALVILPLLPQRTYGPLDVFNPFEAGLIVVLIAGIGFVGYVAMRWLGPGRGASVTGLVGGLVSSTAVTLAMAGRARGDRKLHAACAEAIVLASFVMFVRVIVEVAVINRDLAYTLAAPIGATTLAAAVSAAVVFFRSDAKAKGMETPEISNPVELASALKFGAVFVAALFATKAASEWFGTGGLYGAAFFAGATDVDAISISLAKLASEDVRGDVAATGVMIACLTNTVAKWALASFIGGVAFARRLAVSYAPILVVGGLAIAWLQW